MLTLTGVAFGGGLHQSAFGFTSAFRVLLADMHSAGFRAQMVMLGVACVLFFPLLASGTSWGRPVAGFVSPVGVSVMFGAFVFGIGMQSGGRCGFRHPEALGGGSARMLMMGGLLLGFRARLAYGCNIAAFFGGIASGVCTAGCGSLSPCSAPGQGYSCGLSDAPTLKR